MADATSLLLTFDSVSTPVQPCNDDQFIKSLLESAFIVLFRASDNSNFFAGSSTAVGVLQVGAFLTFPCSGQGNLTVNYNPLGNAYPCMVQEEDVVFRTFGQSLNAINPCSNGFTANGSWDRFSVTYNVAAP